MPDSFVMSATGRRSPSPWLDRIALDICVVKKLVCKLYSGSAMYSRRPGDGYSYCIVRTTQYVVDGGPGASVRSPQSALVQWAAEGGLEAYLKQPGWKPSSNLAQPA